LQGLAENALLLLFQLYEQLPDVLGSAEVLVVIFEPEADVFSLRSKALTYDCAGWPILAGFSLTIPPLGSSSETAPVFSSARSTGAVSSLLPPGSSATPSSAPSSQERA
jgi:hypothetical protein